MCIYIYIFIERPPADDADLNPEPRGVRWLHVVGPARAPPGHGVQAGGCRAGRCRVCGGPSCGHRRTCALRNNTWLTTTISLICIQCLSFHVSVSWPLRLK